MGAAFLLEAPVTLIGDVCNTALMAQEDFDRAARKYSSFNSSPWSAGIPFDLAPGGGGFGGRVGGVGTAFRFNLSLGACSSPS